MTPGICLNSSIISKYLIYNYILSRFIEIGETISGFLQNGFIYGTMTSSFFWAFNKAIMMARSKLKNASDNFEQFPSVSYLAISNAPKNLSSG